MEVGYKDQISVGISFHCRLKNYLYHSWKIVSLVRISLCYLTFLGYIPMPFNLRRLSCNTILNCIESISAESIQFKCLDMEFRTEIGEHTSIVYWSIFFLSERWNSLVLMLKPFLLTSVRSMSRVKPWQM